MGSFFGIAKVNPKVLNKEVIRPGPIRAWWHCRAPQIHPNVQGFTPWVEPPTLAREEPANSTYEAPELETT